MVYTLPSHLSHCYEIILEMLSEEKNKNNMGYTKTMETTD
jgi:hypothetical protein